MSNNTDDIKTWLLRYRNLINNINALKSREEALRIRNDSPKISHIDGMPHSENWNNDRIGNSLAVIDEIQTAIKREQRKAEGVRKEIEKAIDSIKGKDAFRMRLILKLKYIDGFGWQDINDILWLSESEYLDKCDSYQRRTYKIHNKALQLIII